MAEFNKKLYYRKNNATKSIKLYTTTAEAGADRLAIRDGSVTVYAKLGPTNDGRASDIRVRKGSNTLAIHSTAGEAETLTHGNMTEGYFGTISPGAANYIEPWKVLNAVWNVGASDKASLQSQWGSKGNGNLTFSGGTAYPTATDNLGVPWMKFALGGKILLTPQRPFAHSISWNQINAKGAVFGKNINIGGVNYKCRLFRGANTDPVTGSSTARHDQSEWDKLMYKVAATSANGTAGWANFSTIDLGLDGQGYRSWCQETSGAYRVHRGNGGVVNLFYYNVPGTPNDFTGFRPVLELIP